MRAIAALILLTATASHSPTQAKAPPTAQDLGYPAGCKAIYGGTAGAIHLIRVDCAGPDLSEPPKKQPVPSTTSGDELAHVILGPQSWSVALSRWRKRLVDPRELRPVGCVGLEDTRMLCSWKERTASTWRTHSAWADLSDKRAPHIVENAEAPK